jgi:hemolysin III
MEHGEKFNSITHMVGAGLAVVGAPALIVVAARQGDARKLVSLAIYGAMLVLLYTSSVLYHSLRGRAKDVFRVFDHCAIYLLIAGTYTPFTLVTLRGGWGAALFITIWLLAFLGVMKDVFLHRRFRAISIALYFIMGWLMVVAFTPLRRALPPAGVIWLVVGGLLYTSGIVFYALSKRTLHGHGIWHLFVLGGSICHFIAVYLYVARSAAHTMNV